MFQLAVFLILLIILINRPLLGVVLCVIAVVCWIAFAILAVLWPIFLALTIAAVWGVYKLRKEVVVNIQRD